MLRKLLRKYKKELLFTTLLVVTFFLIRITNLTLIPIFTDEAIYIRWAEIARYDANWRFISLTDGKQPLFIWSTMIMVRFFQDPLFAGRLVSVIVGFFSMIGLFFLGRELFKNKWVGFLGSGLYLFYPFALMYDRMALMDSMVGMFCIWALFFEVLLARALRLDVALILGMVIGGGILTKTSGFFNIYLLPFTLVFFPWNQKKCFIRLAKWLGLVIIAILESQIMYAVLRLSPFFNMIATKNSVFVYPFSEWLEHPMRFFWGNLRGLGDWFIGYVHIPVALLMLFSLFIERKHTLAKLLCLAWFAVPMVALALFGRVLYPRFILFMTLPLLPLAALSLFKLKTYLKKPALFGLVVLASLIPWLRTDYFILTNPYRADIPRSDSTQYLNDWPAGGGVNEVVAFLRQESKKGKVYVATEGTFGPLPYALEVYLYKNQNVEIHGFWPLKPQIPAEATESAAVRPTYFVFNQTQEIPPGWPLKLLATYRKGIGKVYLTLCQVISNNAQ